MLPFVCVCVCVCALPAFVPPLSLCVKQVLLPWPWWWETARMRVTKDNCHGDGVQWLALMRQQWRWYGDAVTVRISVTTVTAAMTIIVMTTMSVEEPAAAAGTCRVRSVMTRDEQHRAASDGLRPGVRSAAGGSDYRWSAGRRQQPLVNFNEIKDMLCSLSGEFYIQVCACACACVCVCGVMEECCSATTTVTSQT